MPGNVEGVSSWIAEGRVGVAQGEWSGVDADIVIVEAVGECESSGMLAVRGR